MALPEIGPEASKSHESREGLQGLQGSRASKKSSHLKADNLRTSVASVAGATQDAEGQRSTSLKIPVQPSLSKRSVSTLGTSRTVWSSNRWLAECTAGLKATESKCWSQLLQNLTGEQVKWGPAKSPKAPTAPNKRRLAKKALHGILLRKPNQRVVSHEDRRMVRKELSRESVAFSDDALEHERSLDTRSRKNPSLVASNTVDLPVENGTDLTRASIASMASRLSSDSVDLLAVADMKQRMKQIVHKRLRSVRESVLRQRNENYAQKRYERLPQKEREALERAFFQYDADLSGFLEWDEVVPALRELGLSGSNAIEKREIIQVCRNVVTASQMQSIHVGTTSMNLQEVLNQQRSRMQNQPRVKLGVVRKKRGSKKRLTTQTSGVASETKEAEARASTKPQPGLGSENSSRRSSKASGSEQASGSEGSDSEDFDTGANAEPFSEASFNFLTFVGILVPKVRQRLTELQSTKVMRYFCNFDREGAGTVSVFKCLEIARCLRMEQHLMVEALQVQGFENEPGVSVDFDSFERAIMTCREHTNRQLREREVDILVEMKVSPTLFEECRDDILQIYEIFRRLSGDAGSIGVLTANDAFLSVYELGLMPRHGWQRECVKYFLVPEDSDDHVYMNTELNFEEFLEFLRKVRHFNDEQRLEELQAKFQRLDKDRNGVLDMQELHVLLEESQCSPRTRKEQEEVQQLIQSVDSDGNNVIDFDEFKELVQRIDEKFASLRYEQEVEYAIARGFSETELGSFRAIFEHLDTDNSGQLDMGEVRQCLSIMQHNSTWQAFEQTWALLDKDSSGSLEFIEFIDFMRFMRDGEGVFAIDADQKLPSQVKKLDERTLRSVLGAYGLSKSYLWALDKAQLLQLFCDSLGVTQNDSLQEVLKLTTLSDLIKLAKEKGEQLANLLL